jgi:hypothetical protein
MNTTENTLHEIPNDAFHGDRRGPSMTFYSAAGAIFLYTVGSFIARWYRRRNLVPTQIHLTTEGEEQVSPGSQISLSKIADDYLSKHKQNLNPLKTLQVIGVAELQSEEELTKLYEILKGRGVNPFSKLSILPKSKWLDFFRYASESKSDLNSGMDISKCLMKVSGNFKDGSVFLGKLKSDWWYPILKTQNPNGSSLVSNALDLPALAPRMYRSVSEMLADMSCLDTHDLMSGMFPGQQSCQTLLSLWIDAGRPHIDWPDGKWDYNEILNLIHASMRHRTPPSASSI